ncbi:hypothetical protein QUC31_016171 [Theobroma cacao]|uniref:Uncharacterized protein LOC18603600 n=2 Tax=Theobroma cacao TaxID=3641 RepID=A0AB32V8G0_THECC|nr:PREDICTED: uncharacterized protein LOC18603600 [Theobroma cacao]EOY06657.1 Uncharacterized protein TCM_021313 [Theobroma cacao]
MAGVAREMEDFKAANRTFGGEWRLATKDNNTSSNQPSSHRSTPDPPPQPIRLRTPPMHNKASNNYTNYNYNSRPTWGVGNPELKRQRRVVKYKSYAVEAKLKSSLRHGFRWMKNKYCEFVRGY